MFFCLGFSLREAGRDYFYYNRTVVKLVLTHETSKHVAKSEPNGNEPQMQLESALLILCSDLLETFCALLCYWELKFRQVYIRFHSLNN